MTSKLFGGMMGKKQENKNEEAQNLEVIIVKMQGKVISQKSKDIVSAYA